MIIDGHLPTKFSHYVVSYKCKLEKNEEEKEQLKNIP